MKDINLASIDAMAADPTLEGKEYDDCLAIGEDALFRSDYRKRRREVEDAEGNYAKTLKSQPAQGAHLEFEELRLLMIKMK